jgi:outer membrane protein assembly factor BamE (lipoprotein component of BamABCDE complex)
MNAARRRLCIVLLSTALCAACAGSGFQWDKARQIETGMTQDQVLALMGPPSDVRTQTYGVAWTWAYLNPREGSARVVSVAFREGRVVYGAGVPESFK